MNEKEIKEAIIAHYTSDHYGGKQVHWKQEVCSYYDSSVRFDLAFCEVAEAGTHNEEIKLIGVEVKSDKDSFKRLTWQLPAYLKIFDEVYLAIENKNPPKQMPQLIGIIKVEKLFGKGHCQFLRNSQIRTPDFADYQNDFVYKRALTSLNFPMCNNHLLHSTLSQLWKIRKKFIANTIFGTRLSVDEYNDKEKMQFTIPFTQEETTLLQKIFGNATGTEVVIQKTFGINSALLQAPENQKVMK